MLEKYIARDEGDVEKNSAQTSNDAAMANAVSVIDETDIDDDGFEGGVPFPLWKPKESWRDVHVADDLSTTDITKVLGMLESFSDVLTDIRGVMTASTHAIKVLDKTSINI